MEADLEPLVVEPEQQGKNAEMTGNMPASAEGYDYPPLKKQLDGMIAGPVGLSVKGSGTQEAQALNLEVDLTPVRLRIPEQLSKEAGAPMKLTTRLTGAAASGGAAELTRHHRRRARLRRRPRRR